MQYFTAQCREKANFLECAKRQFTEYYHYTEPVLYTSEVAITLNFNFDKYKGKKILVVGGGPTTDECEWDASNYDYVFSCNHFFLHPRLQEVELASLSPEVNIDSEPFKQFYDNSKTFFIFENVDCNQEYVQRMLKLDRTGLSTIRLRDKTGSVGRLLVIAASFNPSEVHVVGMDGMPKGMGQGDDSKHAFEHGKKIRSKYYSYDFYLSEYTKLWDYLRNDIGKDIKFKNLGHGHPYNISTRLNIL